ncbi:dual specificity phosphatase catalytic domain protein [Phlyctema vagabunda]|uniref:Dual specificity phosphatase catalytic domain protein n=1 Tax=Phlyctema vagabunda TaxID=108571 RepID=A0ABR4PIT0_9HELO
MSFLRVPCLILLLTLLLNVIAAPDNDFARISTTVGKLVAQDQALLPSIRRLSYSQGKFGIFVVLAMTVVCGLLPGYWCLQRLAKRRDSKLTTSSGELLNDGMSQEVRRNVDADDAKDEDPGLLKKHSEIRSFTTTRFTYPSLRVFYRRHPQAEKLPTTPAPLPLLVFIHGLGGSVAQFNPLLTSLVNLASCLSIDLPGCGLSEFEPRSWDAYTTDAMVELLATIIEDYREKDAGQGVVLIGHSMGCSLAALLASKSSPQRTTLSEHVVGLVAICPKAEPPSEEQAATFRKLLLIPGPIFDLWRRWDRRGGPQSASVARFVGVNADEDTKKLQERFNSQSKTPVWRRMASGSIPHYKSGVATGGLPGREVWAGLEVPIFLVAGEADHITKAAELERIASFLGKSHPLHIELNEKSEPIVDSAAPVDTSFQASSRAAGNPEPAYARKGTALEIDTDLTRSPTSDPSTPNEELSIIPPQPSRPRAVLKTTIIPSPANHALLYTPTTVRTLAGLISDFLNSQVSPRLSLGWQLQFLSTSGKWDVKNLAKWQAVAPVSEPIANIFRAMKTLREVDESHCPEVFVRSWRDEIKDIVDISHESPVYDPRGLENGGIRYHKFPTVSKIPPTGPEVASFISLIDKLRKERTGETCYIGVHCHYGFNRTGFFIVCYLVERCGYSVQGAIDEFAKKRPKGIKHAHFLDQLFVRYCVGLKRAPTL